MPNYRHACSTEPPLILRNRWICLELYRRSGGWGWGELYDAEGGFLAVLDHLGEIKARGQDIPMRLEAETAERSSTAQGETLSFPVVSSVIPEKLAKSSFSNWMNFPLDQPLLSGRVEITLPREKPVLQLRYRLRSLVNLEAAYIRGPWLKVGEGSFGTQKDDAVFPGVEWVCGKEWSSGTDWFKDPWALKFAPHRNKVSVPVMAVSHGGKTISLSWKPDEPASRWFNGQNIYPQPVFATPNFIDRADNQLMGLMIPDACCESQENKTEGEPALELHLDQEINLEAEIALTEGGALGAVVDWVNRHGMPSLGSRQGLTRDLDHIASAYNTNLWTSGQGFGCVQNPESVGPRVPAFLRRYVRTRGETDLVRELREKIDWCDRKSGGAGGGTQTEPGAPEDPDMLLELQRADGSFAFDPDGRHYVKDDFVVTREYAEPMGLAGETALDVCLLPALSMLDHYGKTKDGTYLEAALRALDYCLDMKRPEGGDYWETPLRSPNLFAAGHAAIANYLGFLAAGEEKYREKAVYWIRCLLPFTHLWEPEGKPMLFNTKPCLCSSDWYFANWVRDHVQWEVLHIFSDSAARGIDWNKVDPQVDWHAYHRGITAAAARWMIDHTRDNWRPHNMPWTLAMYREGKLDGCFPDTHNSVTGHYGGMAIPPEAIADNIYALIDEGALEE